MHRLIGLLGIVTMMGIAFLISTDRRAIRRKTVAACRSPSRIS
jgi:nucleoside permease NupC